LEKFSPAEKTELMCSVICAVSLPT